MNGTTLCLKKRPTFDLLYFWHPITIIVGRGVTEKVRNQLVCFVFPPHLSSASALSRERGNSEDSAHWCIVRATQPNRCSTFNFLSPEPCPQQPRGECIVYKIQGAIQQRETWVWVVSQKDWRNQAATGWILAIQSEKCNFRVSQFCQVVQKHK